MKNVFLLLHTFMLLAPPALAQTGTIAGTVLDAETKHAIEGANVLLLENRLGTNTAKDGSFILQQVPFGDYVLQVSYIGYTTIRKSMSLNSAKNTDLKLFLTSTILPGQTIVITATRGRERETPAPFASITANDIAQRYSVQDVPQLLSELPSTTFYSDNGNGIGYTYLNIRGFDQKRISVMVNGIPQNDPEDHDVYWLDFPDLTASLEDIQVQRGAGSAFYGPPAIGGSVNLITTSFSRKPSVSLYSGFGSYNTRKYSASVNSGFVNEKYLFFGRLGKIVSDGYRDKSWTDFSSYFLSAVRFDETMTTQINFYGGPVADHLAYYGIPKADAYSSDSEVRRTNPIARPEEIENFSQPHYEFLHEWRLSDFLALSNTFFLVTGDGFFDYDGSWAPYSYYRITPANGFAVSGNPDTLFIPDALIRATVSNKQYGWLPRVTYNHENGRLTAGAEFRIHRSLHWGALRWGNELPIGINPDYHYYEYRGGKDMFSLYAQESYNLRDDLTLLLSLQYVNNTYHLYDEKYLSNDFSVLYGFLNPKLGANLNLTREFNIYTQISRTSREPRLKNLYDAAEASTPWTRITPQFDTTNAGRYDFTKPLVKPEHLTNIELGFGYNSDFMRIGVNLYYMIFQDEIINTGMLDRFGQPVTGNAEKTSHNGIEVTAMIRPLEGLEVHANASLSRNRLEQYSDYSTGNRVELNGNVITGFPEFLGNLRVQYNWIGLSLGVAAQHVGESYTDNFQNRSSPDPSKTVDAYTVCNGWFSYDLSVSSTQSIELQLQVNNMFNLVYASHGEGDNYFPAATRNFFASMKVNL
jgi:iron complex outermembrane recepter protein